MNEKEDVMEVESAKAEDDASFCEVVRRHFHLNFVTDDEADEALAHFSRDVSEDFMATFQFHAEHGSSEDLGNFTANFDGFFVFVLG